jgi:hypothetical protein
MRGSYCVVSGLSVCTGYVLTADGDKVEPRVRCNAHTAIALTDINVCDAPSTERRISVYGLDRPTLHSNASIAIVHPLISAKSTSQLPPAVHAASSSTFVRYSRQ